MDKPNAYYWQRNEQGDLFWDAYLHSECELVRINHGAVLLPELSTRDEGSSPRRCWRTCSA